MVILLDENKTLRITKNEPIYKFETGIDAIKILVPQKYKDISMDELTCIVLVKKKNENKGLFKYMNYNEDLYKNRLYFDLPITSTLTKESDEISLWLMFMKKNDENPKYADNVMQTNNVTFYIYDNGSQATSSEESFDEIWEHTTSDEINEKIDTLSGKVDTMSNTKADTITLDEDNNLVLKSNNTVLCSVKLTDDVTWEEWK